MRSSALLSTGLGALVCASAAGSYFTPRHSVSGIGVGRTELSADLLALRTDAMIQAQTFAILREPRAVLGAQRITGPKLQAIFRTAARSSGLPAEVIEAVAYLESWGDPLAESGAGPKGIMQISEGTAKRIGLQIVRATRYRTKSERVTVKRRGQTTYRTVRKKTPYTVTVRDDRLLPDRAIPAAARYLAAMEQKFGGRDWAIFAYHCGEGCVTEMMELTRRAHGIPRERMTVAGMFFSCSPAWNRELYEAVRHQMSRDYSPTYWFRIRRAQQLLAAYRKDKLAFAQLAASYKSEFHAPARAPHRLAVWLRKEDLVYLTRGDLGADGGQRLARAPDRPEWFNYSLRPSLAYPQASPAALGTLAYVAYETRRLHDELRAHERFRPLEVTLLVRAAADGDGPDALAHASGQVFDIALAPLPTGERECLRAVLNDLGWSGYLGFVEDGSDTLHIGCAPTQRDFFTAIFQEAVGS